MRCVQGHLEEWSFRFANFISTNSFCCKISSNDAMLILQSWCPNSSQPPMRALRLLDFREILREISKQVLPLNDGTNHRRQENGRPLDAALSVSIYMHICWKSVTHTKSYLVPCKPLNSNSRKQTNKQKKPHKKNSILYDNNNNKSLEA